MPYDNIFEESVHSILFHGLFKNRFFEVVNTN